MKNNDISPDGPVVVWFRKDLRLDDNHALDAAARSGRPVIPIYIREPKESGNGPLGAAQAWWLHHSLEAQAKALADLGSRLIVRTGAPDHVLAELTAETGASAIYWNRRYDPKGIAVDGPLKDALGAKGLEVKSFAGQLLHEPSRLKTGSGTHYRVYTPFWRALETSGEPDEPLDPPARLLAPQSWPAGEKLVDWNLLPRSPDWAKTFTEIWTPGEAAALERLHTFIEDSLSGYRTNRDRPAADGTSRLSPHLAMGEISPARIWHATRRLKHVPPDDMITFRKELAWREFSYHLLFHNPDLVKANLNRRYDGFGWIADDTAFERWTKGTTGYPVVDAGMRQLWRHGTMHNRVRMITASFLIKDLLIDWRLGEAWFRDTLVDADPASNAASWQWVAGSGADASPFFRVFNPVLQGEKFDPDGDYVKTFVPELKGLPAKFIHRPFEAPESVLNAAGISLGKTYPRPLVDHAKARVRALAAYSKIKDEA